MSTTIEHASYLAMSTDTESFMDFVEKYSSPDQQEDFAKGVELAFIIGGCAVEGSQLRGSVTDEKLDQIFGIVERLFVRPDAPQFSSTQVDIAREFLSEQWAHKESFKIWDKKQIAKRQIEDSDICAI